MADPCVHQHQTLAYNTPILVRYRCNDCNLETWYVPMTKKEIQQWIVAKNAAKQEDE